MNTPQVPVDPDAAEHRRVLLAELDEIAGRDRKPRVTVPGLRRDLERARAALALERRAVRRADARARRAEDRARQALERAAAAETALAALRRRLAAGAVLPSRSADPSMSQIARNPSTSRRAAA